MKIMKLHLSTLVIRFYIMMAIIVVALFIGYPLLGLLALPVFFSALMGIQFKIPRISARSSDNNQEVKEASYKTHSI